MEKFMTFLYITGSFCLYLKKENGMYHLHDITPQKNRYKKERDAYVSDYKKAVRPCGRLLFTFR